MKNNKHQIVIGYTLKLFCDGLECLINGFDDFEVGSTVPFNQELLTLLGSHEIFDILIIELNCPTKNDLAFITELIELYPTLKIFLISNTPRIKLSSKLLECGISAYVLKSCSKGDIFTALNKILDDKNYFCSDITKAIIKANNLANEEPKLNLTIREKEVLRLLINCNTNNQIAENLGLSENTVKTHRRNIQAKFGVNNLIGMVRFACRAQLIDFGHDGYCMDCPHCF